MPTWRDVVNVKHAVGNLRLSISKSEIAVILILVTCGNNKFGF